MTPAGGTGVEHMLSMLLTASSVADPRDITALARAAAAHGDLHVATVYVSDMEQQRLRPLAGGETRRSPRIDASLAGRAYRTLAPVEAGQGDGRRLFVPLVHGAERVGVVEVRAEGADREVERRALLLSRALAGLLGSAWPYSDGLERTRRSRPLRLAAELQWALLPPLTLADRGLTVSGILEPCYEIGGDAFDYGIDGDVVGLMLLDAMGHGLDSSLIASLVIGAYRHRRRSGDTLPGIYRSLDALVAQHFGPDRFATGQLAELDRREGTLRWINAGHPPAMLVRGGKVVERSEPPPSLPLGIGDGQPPELGMLRLEPGDAVLWFTDGVVREIRTSEAFDERHLGELLTRALSSGATVPEVVRRLRRSVLDHHAGHLEDDATMLLVRWGDPS